MKLSHFKFDLPDSYIAKHPCENRGDSRLMVLHKDTGEIEHKKFRDIIDYFDEGDVFVVNDTRVFPARLYGNKEKTGALIEIFLLRELNKEMHLWDVMVDPARKIRVGNKLYFPNSDMTAEVVDNTTSRGRTIRFIYEKNGELSHDEYIDIVYSLGTTPIPKYLRRTATEEDKERFQSVFANNTGAISPPFSNLNFTEIMCKMFELKGIDIEKITLHIGLGTFKKVEVEDMTKHKMESESYEIRKSTEVKVNEAILNKKRVCCVGISTTRVVEDSISASKKLKASGGWTNNFIAPPHKFNVCNALLTTFHEPLSIPLIGTCAFGSYDHVIKAYHEAIKNKYHFLCYGDNLLIV